MTNAQIIESPLLAGQKWLKHKGLHALFDALDGQARIAGGAVRNALFDKAISDIDIATPLLPEDVTERAQAHGFKVYPTGIEHGTVSVNVFGDVYEVTTLRRDVKTDGRHAEIAFSDDWSQDAQRRDLTVNALYCDLDGVVYDYVDGLADVEARRMRFVGDAGARVQEDYLRILRFFRFHAIYGRGEPDGDAVSACQLHQAGLENISRERIRAEFLKLLGARGVSATLEVMADCGVLSTMFATSYDLQRLERLVSREARPDPLRRLYALYPGVEIEKLRDGFVLSNAETKRLQLLHDAEPGLPNMDEVARDKVLYLMGRDVFIDRAYIDWVDDVEPNDAGAWRDLLDYARRFVCPIFPLKGEDICAHGVEAGPQVGVFLKALESYWLDKRFAPGREELLSRLKAMIAENV